MGIISGYPVGAKIVTNLRENNTCTKVECERLLSFTNNSGPLFIVGTVGISLLGDMKIGIILLVIHVLASITVGVCFRFWKSEKTLNRSYYFSHDYLQFPKINKKTHVAFLKGSISSIYNTNMANSKRSIYANYNTNLATSKRSIYANYNTNLATSKRSIYANYNTNLATSKRTVSTGSNTNVTFSNLGEVLGKSIMNSINTVVMIGGFVVLFSVIISILENSNALHIISLLLYPALDLLKIPHEFANGIISGAIELTNGLKTISTVPISDFTTTIILSSFLLGFGGVSILLQVFSIISKTDISIKPYIIGKILHAIISVIYIFIFFKFFVVFSLNL